MKTAPNGRVKSTRFLFFKNNPDGPSFNRMFGGPRSFASKGAGAYENNDLSLEKAFLEALMKHFKEIKWSRVRRRTSADNDTHHSSLDD